VIQLDEVSKAFRGAQILDGVNLHFAKGERVALVGANGAGKTTLIRCLLGEYHCEGTVKLAGASPRSERTEVLGRVGFVPQLPPPLKMPVDRLIRFAADLCGSDPSQMEAAASRLGLDVRPIRRRLFTNLSGGQKQKLLIAIALRPESEILILDEPAANLDPDARRAFFEMLAERDRTNAMLISSHRLDEVAALVSRVVELDGGRVVLDESIGTSSPLDAKLYCRVELVRADSAAARALTAWGLKAEDEQRVWEGEVAASDRLRFLGVIARYASLVSSLHMKIRDA
jgi:ABC-2 type transport system ATP-binding protein